MRETNRRKNREQNRSTPIDNHVPPATALSASERAKLEKVEGIVFDVQRYSLHDGPGLRTNIFLKGCPLHCGWCSNPESQKLQSELSLSQHNCINCGQFETPCSVCSFASNGKGLDKNIESEYRKRVLVCPTGAIRWVGERRTAAELMTEVMRDLPFYGDSGGLTLTGGEATMQPDISYALLRLAKAENISTAMETCGHTQWNTFTRLLPYLDHIIFDVKHINSDIHRTFTGLGNELILSNLRQLAATGQPITIRIPLIPGFNATTACMREIGEFVRKINGRITQIDLLPYHTLGQAKYKAIGREYPWADQNRLTDDEVESMANVIRSFGFNVSIGGV